MRTDELDLLLSAVPDGRWLYPYFPDRCALEALARTVGSGMAVRDVRSTVFGRMLDRPAVRDVVGRCGGVLRASQLAACWPARFVTYRLSLGRWRGVQTTRGGGNVVLQLNLPVSALRTAVRGLGADAVAELRSGGHPVRDDALTLAWVRLDVDLDGGEALVEEVQSDLVRLPTKLAARWDVEPRVAAIARDLVAAHVDVWAEASLSAAPAYLLDDLGVGTVWMHTAEGGCVAKRIDGAAPPRSLYTDLPRRFGFVEVDTQPALLRTLRRQRARQLEGVRFQRLGG